MKKQGVFLKTCKKALYQVANWVSNISGVLLPGGSSAALYNMILGYTLCEAAKETLTDASRVLRNEREASLATEKAKEIEKIIGVLGTPKK